MKEVLPNQNEINPLEAALDQGFQATMEYLQKDMGRVSIAPELSRLKDASAPHPAYPENIRYSKTEANALAGYFMVLVWQDAKVWLDKNPSKFRRYGTGSEPKVVVENIEDIASRLSEDQPELLFNLHRSSLETLRTQVDEYSKRMRGIVKELSLAGEPKETWPKEVRSAMRYSEILPASDSRFQRFEGSPSVHIKSGFSASQLLSWVVLGSIPHEYEKHFGRPITNEELEKYIARGKTFVTYIASLHIELFDCLMEELTTKKVVKRYGKHPVWLPVFRNLIFNPDGKFPFEIDKDTLERVAERFAEKEITEPRTGCPAILARDGKDNMISILYDWNADIARKYYYPSSTS